MEKLDMWVLKVNSFGEIQWSKAFGGSGFEEGWDVKQTSDDGYILVGRSDSDDGDLTNNQGLYDFWIVKLNNWGSLEWQRSFGGSKDDNAYSVAQTVDGGYVVAGESFSSDGNINVAHGASDFWVLKLNFEGKIEWEKSLGGTKIDRANDIIQTRGGDYIVFGQTYSNDGDITGNHGKNDYWLVKLAKNGNFMWQMAFGVNGEDYGRSIFQTVDDGYIMAGQTESNNGNVIGNDGGADFWIVKASDLGQIQWQKTIGGTSAELCHSIEQTNDKGYIAAGYAWSNNGDVSGVKGKNDFWVVKLSPESTPTTTPKTLPLEILPNPATHTISINTPIEASNLTICITDLLGRELSRETQTNSVSGSIEVPISTLPDGMYLINVQTDDGRIFTGKFVKQH